MDNLGKIIEIKDLKMTYGDKEVLKGINLDIYKGNIIGYIGSNGAGKSTTIKILLGLIKGYEGSVSILGKDIENEDNDYKNKIGYVPEIAKVYDSLTAKEYLTFIGQIYGLSYEKCDDKAKRLMKVLGIEHAYESRLSSFSKGMKQKVVIISSLIHNPDILFLDEPLSGLDANSVLLIKDILYKLKEEGKTIFYSSHIMEVVQKLSDRIILLNEGKIVADGNFEQIKDCSFDGSLEEIFNTLTGFEDHDNLCSEFVSILKEV
ncbi:ABC transporter ATP-binding protein [Romboutsia sedimentorum]|uniref:ABC transporter ATP-binding protein n=1 Tax=Romboutsia sedimentorum TaxID=1368474 RepID=A0ABT7EAB0_9FIRM|nr:ABC transporter ATP-binding protein [Romboutsia sedimentorum]MDK2563867.1 ABC transporter ATP-binding protein [Romboutsia sedimentorum]